MTDSLVLLFLGLMLVCALAALHVTDLLAAVTIFGAFSFFSAIFFTLLGALDVAFTEAALGAAITTVFFVTAIYRTDREAEYRLRARLSRLSFLPLLAAGAILLYAGRSLPEVGDPDQPASVHVSPRYIEKALEETGAANMVTAVLADYRGYDTLGETVVIFTAGLACLLVLGAFGGNPEPSAADDRMAYAFGSDVVDVSTRILFPFIVLFAAYVGFHGHGGPGGGFQGGAILGAALIVVRLVRGRSARILLDTRHALALASFGVFAYAAIGLACLAFSGNFLDYGALPLPMEAAHVREISTLGVEIGVFFGVTAVLLLIFESLTAGAGE